MALQNVTVTYQAKKANGQVLYPATLAATAATRSAADANIAGQIQTAVDAAGAASQDQLEAQAAFNS